MKKEKIKVCLVVFISLMLIFSMDIPAFAQNENSSQSSMQEVEYGEPGDDYVPGEIIAFVKGGLKGLRATKFFDGNDGSIGNYDLKIKDNLMNVKVDETTVDKAIAISENDTTAYAEAIQEETQNGLKEDVKEDKYSFVLIKCNKKDVSKLIEKLTNIECVKFAEPNAICEDEGYTVNDAKKEPGYKYQWSLNKSPTGEKADIQAEKAYKNKNFKKQKETVVAVMDSGVDYTHPDLQNSMWADGEKYSELISLGGGKYGINTSGDGSTSDPMDTKVGHGTHCSSIIASKWKNKTGVAGVNPNAKIMACRWMSDTGYISNWINAMDYVIQAKKKGVNIVAANNSWGGLNSAIITDSIIDIVANEAGKLGIVSCFAAGNASYNHDKMTHMAYSSPYILTIGAMNSAGEIAYFSERGARTVDVFAPGTQILAATSLQSENISMPSQYLPWVKADGNMFYEDFEDDTDKVTFRVNEIDSEEPEYIKKITSNAVKSKGYGDKSSRRIKLSGVTEGLEYAINMDLTDFSSLIQTNKPAYIAFMGKSVGFNYSSLGEYPSSGMMGLEYYDGTNWKEFQTSTDEMAELLGWHGFESNWTHFSNKNINPVITELKQAADNTGGTLRLRLTFKVDSLKSNTPYFEIDNIGFGNETSGYYYANGTSMATPCAAGVCSLVAGSLGRKTSKSSDAIKIINRVKGSVKRLSALKNGCTTMGCVQADAAYRSSKQLYPVPRTVTVKSGKATIKGNFFGTKKGSVKIDGKKAKIIKWKKTFVKIKLPKNLGYGMKKYIIKRKDKKYSREYAVFKDKQTIKEAPVSYKSLPVSNLTYKIGGKTVHSYDLVAQRICANKHGILAILTDTSDSFITFEFYSFGKKRWNTVLTQEEITELKLKSNSLECYYSIAYGGNEIYAIVPRENDPEDDPNRLMSCKLLTFRTSEIDGIKKIKDVDLSDDFWGGEALGVIDGKLYVAFGACLGDAPSPHNTKIKEINKNTGEYTNQNDLCDIEGPYEFFRMGDFSLSGDSKYFVNMQSLIMNFGGPLMGLYPYKITTDKLIPSEVSFLFSNGITKDGDLKSSTGNGEIGIDSGQNITAAYGATDQGFILAGPARNIGKSDMVDTWIYDGKKDIYKAVKARVDVDRMAAQAGTSYGNTFYVLGRSSSNKKLIFKSLDLSKLGLSTTSIANPARDIN